MPSNFRGLFQRDRARELYPEDATRDDENSPVTVVMTSYDVTLL